MNDTLKYPTPPPKKTLQFIYYSVVRHLHEQGIPCRHAVTGKCRYRALRPGSENWEEAMTCAVGCLMPRGSYDAAMEGQTIHDLFLFEHYTWRDLFGWEPEFPDQALELLTELQTIHDSYPNFHRMRKSLLRLMDRFHGLSSPFQTISEPHPRTS